jgi:hypothetical protein
MNDIRTMNESEWFSARLLFEAQRPDESGVPRLYEDRIVLVEAQDEERAALAAVVLGGESRNEYVNDQGSRVIWEFVELLDLVRLAEAPVNASPVYWQFLDEQDLAAVRRLLDPTKFIDESDSPEPRT